MPRHYLLAERQNDVFSFIRIHFPQAKYYVKQRSRNVTSIHESIGSTLGEDGKNYVVVFLKRRDIFGYCVRLFSFSRSRESDGAPIV